MRFKYRSHGDRSRQQSGRAKVGGSSSFSYGAWHACKASTAVKLPSVQPECWLKCYKLFKNEKDKVTVRIC